MASLTLNKWGHSYGVRIPQVLLRQLQILPGDQLEVESDLIGRCLILKVAAKRKNWLSEFNQKSVDSDASELGFENEFDRAGWTW
ncbi:MAG: hypothetical protein NTV32_01315 [Gammaproteobacteria bacterium]|jgi:antitoxin component of MazEF toxin-antitoxin module|nr:hypothetical protein [Gammaproteobacteria bacterium]